MAEGNGGVQVMGENAAGATMLGRLRVKADRVPDQTVLERIAQFLRASMN